MVEECEGWGKVISTEDNGGKVFYSYLVDRSPAGPSVSPLLQPLPLSSSSLPTALVGTPVSFGGASAHEIVGMEPRQARLPEQVIATLSQLRHNRLSSGGLVGHGGHLRRRWMCARTLSAACFLQALDHLRLSNPSSWP
jgi:hypothetical protein